MCQPPLPPSAFPPTFSPLPIRSCRPIPQPSAPIRPCSLQPAFPSPPPLHALILQASAPTTQSHNNKHQRHHYDDDHHHCYNDDQRGSITITTMHVATTSEMMTTNLSRPHNVDSNTHRSCHPALRRPMQPSSLVETPMVTIALTSLPIKRPH